MKPEIQIIASSSDSNPNLTYLVDPNPSKNTIFDPSDYFLYVNLTAFPKSRSFINLDVNDNVLDNNLNSDFVSFIKTTKQNGEEYTTTNYIETDAGRFNEEGFGIKNIKIDLKNNFVPTVDVEFFDTRSSNINNYEGNNKNVFSPFFSLPYPLFKLTIKGYYGKPVEYCLHLLKFNSNFDSNTGGFVANASFMGYSYAFFADIPLRYIYAIGNSVEGQNLLKQRNSISLSEQMSTYGKISRFVEEEKINNSNYNNYVQLQNLRNEVKILEEKIGRFLIAEDKSILGSQIDSTANIVFFREIGIFNTTEISTILTFVKEANKSIDSINKKLVRLSINEEIPKINVDGKVFSANSILQIKRSEYLDIYEAEVLAGFNLNFLAENGFEDLTSIEYNFIDMYSTRLNVDSIIKVIDQDLKQNQDSLKNLINEEVTSSYNSSLFDYYKVLADNIQVFCELLYNSALSASDTNIKNKRRDVIANYESDIIGEDIYPYPAVILDETYAWVGDIKGADAISFPEINFIKLLINSLLDVNNVQNNINNLESIFNNENAQSTIFPFHPYDVNNNGLLDINLNPNNLDEIIKILHNRFSVLEYSGYLNDNNLEYWAKVESFNLKELINNNTLKIISYNNIVDSISILDDLYEVSQLNPDLNLVNPTVNFIELNKSTSYEASSVNSELFRSIDTRQLTVSTKFKDYINELQVKNTLLSAGNRETLVFDKAYFFFNPINLNVFYTNDISSYLNNLGGLRGLTSLSPILNKENNLLTNILFNESIYKDEFAFYPDLFTNEDVKTFILLSNFGFSPFVIAGINDLISSDKAKIVEYPLLYLIWVYSLYLVDPLTLNNSEIPNKDIIIRENSTIKTIINSRPELLNILKEVYDTYNYNILIQVERFLNEFEEEQSGIPLNDVQIETLSIILNEYKKLEYIIVPAEYSDGILISKNKFTQYFNRIQKELILLLKEDVQANKPITYDDILLKDRDFLIEVYQDIKSIYDKWISLGISKGSVFNVCFNNQRDLIDHFYFVDRSWGDIGKKIVINPRTILNNMKSPRVNCYQHITSVLNDNNFQVFIAPSYIGFRNKQDVEDMFVPQTSLLKVESTPSLIAMYIGGYSNQVNGNTNYKSDGFNINPVDIPSDFSNKTRSDLHNSNIDFNKYNILSFLVNIGDNNQSHFIDLAVSTEEHQNTAEYLKTLSEVIDKGGTIKKFYKGVDIFDLYKMRSFTATVKSMGNMMLQPFQYFQLNVPLFKGAYIITSVSHDLSPHYHTTTFKGQKVSKYRYPLVTEITSYIDLTNYQLADAATSTVRNINLSEDSEGIDFIDNMNIQGNFGNNILLTVVNENNENVNYILSDDLNVNTINQNLQNVFRNNGRDMKTYGLRGAKCMSWVKYILLDLGIRSTPFGGVDAWDFYAGLRNSQLNYFNPSLTSSNTKAYNYSAEINEDLAIVMGYFKTSSYANVSANAILAKNDNIKFEKLNQFKNFAKSDITPITHIGFSYKGVFYDFTNGKVRVNPKTSFIPIAFVKLSNLINSKI